MITGGGVPHHERRLNNSDHLVHCLRSEAESRVVIIVMMVVILVDCGDDDGGDFGGCDGDDCFDDGDCGENYD